MLTSSEIKLAKWLFVFHVRILYYLHYLEYKGPESSCASVTTLHVSFFEGAYYQSISMCSVKRQTYCYTFLPYESSKGFIESLAESTASKCTAGRVLSHSFFSHFMYFFACLFEKHSHNTKELKLIFNYTNAKSNKTGFKVGNRNCAAHGTVHC